MRVGIDAKCLQPPLGGVARYLGGLLAVLCVLFVAKHVETHIIRDAIVLAKEAEVHYGPSIHDQVAFRLGEGLKVYVLDSRKDWSRILLNNGESGWVKNKEIAEV